MEDWVTHTAFHERTGYTMMWAPGHYRLFYSDGMVEEDGEYAYNMGYLEECGWVFEEINFTLENE